MSTRLQAKPAPVGEDAAHSRKEAEPDSRFFGHPKGLAFIAATEAFNAFALFGMLGLLVLYMTGQALLPGHAENIAGFPAFRTFIETLLGPLSTIALASLIFGLYAGLICFTPLLGGWLADRLLGLRKTISIGGGLMLAGHAAMIWERSFLIALLLLIAGSGCLTGNLKAQAGNLYGPEDSRRPRAFALSLIGINLGAFTAPLICGWLGQLYGWSYGFGAAAAGMALGLAVYLAGLRHMPPDISTEPRIVAAPASGNGAILPLAAILAINILYFGTYNQTFNMFALWARDAVDRDIGGFLLPVPWLLALDGLFAIAAISAAMLLWKWQAQRGREPGEMGKLKIGFALLSCAFFALAASALQPEERKSIGFAIAYLLLVAAAAPFIWTSTFALISRRAPARIRSTMMSAYVLSAFAGNLLVGWLGGYYERLAPAGFWLIHAAVAALGLVLLLAFGKPILRRLS